MAYLLELIDKCLALILLPATLCGAGGAFIHARRKGKSYRQTAFEVIGGALTANVLCPLVQEYTPASWHYTLFFLVGWGGLELVSRVYEATALALERRINKKIGGE